MRLKDLAKVVSGKILGNAELKIKGVAPIEEAQAGELVFVLDKKYLAPALNSKAAALVVSSAGDFKNKSAILVKDPRLALARILLLFAPAKKIAKGIHKTAIVPKSCKIGKNVSLGPFVVLEENVSLGNGTVVHPHSYIGEGVKIGRSCVIHPHVTVYSQVKIGNPLKDGILGP